MGLSLKAYSLHLHPTVAEDNLSGNKRAIIGGQKQRQIANALRRSIAIGNLREVLTHLIGGNITQSVNFIQRWAL